METNNQPVPKPPVKISDPQIQEKKAYLDKLEEEAQRLQSVIYELKTGILSALWLDEAPGGIGKHIPTIVGIINTVLIIVILIIKH